MDIEKLKIKTPDNYNWDDIDNYTELPERIKFPKGGSVFK